MYKDIGNDTKAILEDDYNLTHKFKATSTNDSNITVSTEGEISSNRTSASLSIKREGTPLSLEKLRIKNDGRILVELSLKTSDISKFTMSAEDGKQEPGKLLNSFGKIGCEFNSIFKTHVTTDIDVVNGPIIRGAFLHKYNNSFSFGSELVFNTRLDEGNAVSPDKYLLDSNIGLVYKPNNQNYVATCRTYDLFNTYRFSYYYKPSPMLTIATQLDYRLKSPTQKIIVGGKYNLDNNGSYIKAKIDSNAILSGTLVHQITSNAKMSISSEVDINSFSIDSHKSGISLILG